MRWLGRGIALGLLLLAAATALRADPDLHADVLVFVPAYEGSKLFDPELGDKGDDPVCVWGSLDSIRSSDLYFALRMPNELVAKPMISAGPVDVYGDFISGITEGENDATHFHSFTEGADFFIFAYDWRHEIATVTAPLLGEALEKYAQLHAQKTGIPAEQTKFIIVTHSMGGLVARTLISESPEWAPRISGLYLVGCPNLGSVKAIKTLIVGPGGLKENALNFPASLLNILPNSVDANLTKLTAIARPSLYELLPVDDPRWECVAANGSRWRIAAPDLLSVGPWEPYWPSPELEQRLFINGWLKKQQDAGRKDIHVEDWTYCQDPSFKPLQRMLAAAREWRLRMGSLSYTNTLMTRPGEDSRLHIILGTGLKTPTGIITEGAHDSSLARYTYAPDNDGDETVTGASVLDDLHPSTGQVKLLDGVSHGKLLNDAKFLTYFCNELSSDQMVPALPVKERPIGHGMAGGTVP